MNPNEEPSKNNSTKEAPPMIFQPITEGLGFHSSTEVDVASPKVKRAALQAKSMYQASALNKPVLPSATPVLPVAQPQPQPQPQPQSQLATPTPAYQAPKTSTFRAAPVSIKKINLVKENAPPFTRTLAYLIDWGIHTILGVAMIAFLLYREEFSITLLMQPWALGILFLSLYFTHALLLVIQEILFQTSFGKNLLGLQIHGNPIILLLRAVIFHLSFFALGIGPALALFRKDRRGLDDLITDTSVTLAASPR